MRKEIAKAIRDLGPMPPRFGPPLPWSMEVSWPWRGSYYLILKSGKKLDVDEGLQAMAKEKRREWMEKGCPEKMSEKAVEWALNWCRGVIYMMSLEDEDAEYAVKTFKRLFPQSLDKAESWWTELREVFIR